MKIRIVPVVLAVATLLFASCLGSDNEETITYNDTAISSFSLGTLNKYVTTKTKDGKSDSIYKTTVAGSTYKFYIDQQQRLIYNADSLPKGVDVAHVLCTVGSKNSGTIAIKSLVSDSLKYYSSSDSVDFSSPREFRVYANDGSGYRSYMVKVNVHQEDADSFTWTRITSGYVPDYVPSTGGSVRRYKVEDGQLKMSADDGDTWTVEKLDDSASYLPSANVNFAYKSMTTNDDTEYVLMVGTGDADTKHALCWFKYDEYDASHNNGWSRITFDADSKYALPKLSNLCVVRYGDYMLAIGGKGMDECTVGAYETIYTSFDNGVNWRSNKLISLPANFDKTATDVKMVVDSDHNLWLICSGTGQVWRGRLNKYGWTDPQMVIYE